MPVPKRITWFFIADGAKARLIESTGYKGAWERRGDWEEAEARMHDRDLERDRPTRGRDIAKGEPYAVERPSAHEKAAEEFLVERARELEQASRDDCFDQLVIAAAPAALGHLRKKLSPEVTAKLIGAFDKDVTNESDKDLHAYFLEKLERW